LLDVRQVKINLKQRAWQRPDPNYSRDLAVGDASATDISRMVDNYRMASARDDFRHLPLPT
jgi:hypothetical protein